jgi:drug/metabolite transporter (DMT)-like permease
MNVGDFLCILGAALYAAHIIVTGELTRNVDSITLGILQLGFAGVLGLLFSLSMEETALPSTTESWYSVLALSILCSAIGFVAQTVAQNHTNPTHTGLIFSLEPVFAAIFAFLFADEALSLRGYLGAAIILFSVLNAEVDLKKLFFQNVKKNKFAS